MSKIDRIIKLIKENMIVGTGGFTGSAKSDGPVAGYDPVIAFRKRGKVDYRRVPHSYKTWVKFLQK
jgi:hypothetical protein